MSSYTTRSDSLIGPVFLLAAVFAGCAAVGHSDIGDIQRKPTSKWTDDDCRTIVLNATSYNLHDDRARIKVFATPFSPIVVAALTRADQIVGHWSNDQFEQKLEDRLLDESGILYDIRSKSYFDKGGRPYQSVQQMDSLIFLVDMVNITWPCTSPTALNLLKLPGGTIGSVRSIFGNIPMSDYPCITPDISHLQNQIFLENDHGKLLKPNAVWGRRQNILTKEETLLVMFQFRWGDYHFLSGAQKLYLNIEELGDKIHLPFPLVKLR